MSLSGGASPFVPVVDNAFVGGVVSLLHVDSYEDEESSALLVSVGERVTPSCFVASRVGPPPLWDPSVLSSVALICCPDASAGVGPDSVVS